MSNYPSPPGHRMAYDRDGTIVSLISGGVPTQQAGAVVTSMNSETPANTIASGGTNRACFLFPQKRDLVGVFATWNVAVGWPNHGIIEYSTDTTTGVDGTWTTATTTAPVDGVLNPDYRTNITAVNAAGIIAVRVGVSDTGTTLRQVHLYGDISAGSEGDSLQLWDPAVDQRLAAGALDFGDIPRSNVTVKQFRVKNRSAAKTANNTVVGIEALTDTSPSVPGQHQFSTDGVTYAATITIPAIAPAAISPIIYVKRSTAAAAALTLWACRITAVPGSWT